MTPSILQPLFQQWREEGLSFCVTSENYNRSDLLGKSDSTSAGGGGIFSYPFAHLIESSGYWQESNHYNEEPPTFLTKDLIERIALHLMKHIKPKVIYLQVTTKCNYLCPMCPFHGSGYEGKYFKDNPSLKPQNMPLDEAKRYVDKIVDYGASVVAMSPEAEFFVYPYWEEISRYIKSKGLRISATTNGSLVNEEAIAKLKDIGFDELIFSIDSVNQETYAKVRSPKEKDYQTAISAPILAAKAGIRTQVHFVQQKPNLGEKEEVFSYYKNANIHSITFGIELHTEADREQTLMPIERKQYIHGLCGAYNNLVILIDGNLVSCCGFANRYKYIKSKLDAFSLREHSIAEVLSYQHSLLANKDKDVMGLCCNCDLYQIAFEAQKEISVQKNYVIIKKAISEYHLRIPKELESIPDNLLSWMYQNNIITRMKQDKIL
ncbi:radical SAM/SPASM domain-containing protein [Helicobacter sp. MIT 05-5294]|uniref:radical SAM/SPASM domain-containing protein n=1 Tax=Helicobacter sp. MIT 05-5294 TaxID=1548150 RepID=UPI0018836D17|nr:radical SAM/SPASM domain-containing protein [Helicobacter sp. MIT 05-5294]